MRETGTGQQVARLHDRNMMMMMTIILNNVKPNGIPLRSETLSYMWHTLALMDLMMVVD